MVTLRETLRTACGPVNASRCIALGPLFALVSLVAPRMVSAILGWSDASLAVERVVCEAHAEAVHGEAPRQTSRLARCAVQFGRTHASRRVHLEHPNPSPRARFDDERG